jgi:hypothetical protein
MSGERDPDQGSSFVPIAAGALLMAGSIFFPFANNATKTFFELICQSYWDPELLWILMYVAWPNIFGMLEAASAFLLLLAPKWWGHRVSWIASVVFLVTIAGSQLWLLWKHGGNEGPQKAEALREWMPAVLFLVGFLLALMLVRTPFRRHAIVRMLGTVWVILSFCPVSGDGWVTMLKNSGPGYWMLIGGAFLLVAGSVQQVLSCTNMTTIAR